MTVDLDVAGAATGDDDFTISATQIVIPTGSSSGEVTVTVTAVQDALDEPDETVVVDISSVTNGEIAGGGQQLTITVLDDDEPPTIDLTVSPNSVNENGGVAIATVSLSVPSGQDVMVNLSASGTAMAGAEYSLSVAQITIAAGSTNGAATVTAVDDALDELDETIDLTIAATNATVGVGAQRVTISDDDDPVTVALSVDTTAIAEAAGVATFTATLSRRAPDQVVIDLAASGTATPTSDYTLSANQITIPVGSTTGSVTVTAVQGTDSDPEKTVTVEIAGTTGATEEGEQRQTVTIDDDDVPPTFRVTSLATTSTGFVAQLNEALDTSALNLYDTQSAGLDLADVVVEGGTGSQVSGSLIIDSSLRMIAFVKTGGPLTEEIAWTTGLPPPR